MDQVLGIAKGLKYLHQLEVVHGNICPNNILISDNSTACISDIGLHVLLHSTRSAEDHCFIPKSWMFKSPEALFPSTATRPAATRMMDVYSFACTIYTIYSGRPPFSSFGHDPGDGIEEIRRSGHSGLHRPRGMRNALWSTLKQCWNLDALQRPSMKEIVELLQHISDNPKPKRKRFSRALRHLYIPLVKITSLRFTLP